MGNDIGLFIPVYVRIEDAVRNRLLDSGCTFVQLDEEAWKHFSKDDSAVLADVLSLPYNLYKELYYTKGGKDHLCVTTPDVDGLLEVIDRANDIRKRMLTLEGCPAVVFSVQCTFCGKAFTATGYESPYKLYKKRFHLFQDELKKVIELDGFVDAMNKTRRKSLMEAVRAHEVECTLEEKTTIVEKLKCFVGSMCSRFD